MGQGGWSAARFEEAIGEPVTIEFRSAIPVEVPLALTAEDEGWQLHDGDRLVMTARPGKPNFRTTEPVGLAAAAAAGRRFPGAATAIFDEAGSVVALADAFWVAVRND